jgi:hypothetical protein
MGELQVALYETQKKCSKPDTAPTNTTLSNDCLDNEDVILSCCAGLVRMKVSAAVFGLTTVSFFRMPLSCQKQKLQYTDNYLYRYHQIVRFRNTSSAFMATERGSYERTIWLAHVSNISVLTTRIAHAASAATQGSTGLLTVVRVTPVIPKKLPNVCRK